MAGSNNFETFNPNCTNQESDTTYLADSTRVGGITFNQTMKSLLGNKVFYQATIMSNGLGQALANKGFVVNDGSANPATALANLVAVLSNILTTADSITTAIYKLTTQVIHTGTTTRDIVASASIPALTTSSIIRMTLHVTSETGNSTFSVSFGSTIEFLFNMSVAARYHIEIIVSPQVATQANIDLTITNVGDATFTNGSYNAFLANLPTGNIGSPQTWEVLFQNTSGSSAAQTLDYWMIEKL